MSDLLNRIDLRFDWVKEKLAGVSIDEETGCWEYQGAKSTDGYGRFHIYANCMTPKKRKYRAHRVAYAFFHGVDPAEKCVCHSCDNPACVNPEHLWLGTHQQNNDDKIRKGRAARQDGLNNSSCKLDSSALERVVEMLQEGATNKVIGAEMGVTHSNISLIRLGRLWAGQTAALGWEPKAKFKRKAA